MSNADFETRSVALSAGGSPRRHGVSAAVGDAAAGNARPAKSVEGVENEPRELISAVSHGSTSLAFGPPRRGAVMATAASAASALFEGLEHSSKPPPALKESWAEPEEAGTATSELKTGNEHAAFQARGRDIDGSHLRKSHDDQADRLPSSLDDRPMSSPSGKTSQCIAARVAAAVKAAEPQGGDAISPKQALQSTGADLSTADGLAQGMDVGDLLQELSDLAPAAVEHDAVEVLPPSDLQAVDSPTQYQTPPSGPQSIAQEGTSHGDDAAHPQAADAELCKQLESIQQKLSKESPEKDAADSPAKQAQAELQEERERQHAMAKALKSEVRAHEECSEELEERNAEIRRLHAEVAQCMARSKSEAEQELRELRASAARVDGQAIALQDGSPPQNFEAVEARVVEAAEDSAHAREQLEIALKELRAPSPPLLTTSGEQPKGGAVLQGLPQKCCRSAIVRGAIRIGGGRLR